MNKEARIRRLEENYLVVINSLDETRCPQNWRTNGDKVKASLDLATEEALILAELASLKRSYPHVRGALECLSEANGFASPNLIVDIARQALIASLTYPKYIDNDASGDLDLGEFDNTFNRFSTFLQSAAAIATIKLGLD
ncbi:hypothetical protein A3A48_02545 [Candidatus Curtissbacteria bacterium RIFCSPLOWO2_01_FULL_37_9]|uniref:Uncharacterized protein n=1 Tax=Candidatus Curtissbacteria bacterium RIFCSPLOWO2_01_FULL_37_9 TaxID=1797724 RepID=A0A1F5GQT3_9BACT|nr:MAG: hypothetical protein A3A48_02545 [Candidatus Curtissbacteria bacterium RIFCSPLOWO2_01_FULL_37_9]